MKITANTIVIPGMFLFFGVYLLIVMPREARQDAIDRDMDPPIGRPQYLFTPNQFIGRCGKPKAVAGENLDYGEILVTFRPADDGIAAHFYQKGRSEEIDGAKALNELGCTL